MKHAFWLIAVSFIVVSSYALSAPRLFTGDHHVVNFTQQFSMEVWWNKEHDDEYLYFDVLFLFPLPDYQERMYFAIGFGDTYNESDYITLLDWPTAGWCLLSTTSDTIDVVICTFYLNEARCDDRHNGRFPVQPVNDTHNDIQRFRSEGIWDKFVRMGWKRKVDTGDTDDYQFQLGNTSSVIWAYGSYNTTTIDLNPPNEYGMTLMDIPNYANDIFKSGYVYLMAWITLVYFLN